MTRDASGFDASRVQVLEGPEAVRKRAGMYVGSTGERGLHEMVFEVAGLAVNAVLPGRVGYVDVALLPDGGVRVAHDGPGVPFQAVDDTAGPGLEALLTQRCAGAGPLGRHVAAVSHLGPGRLCVANALSSRLTAEARYEGVRRVQEYARGVAVAPPAVAGPATGSGITLAFWPDADVFETAECSFAVLAERFRELAFLNRGLGISLTDSRTPGGSRSARFRFPAGTRDFVAFLDSRAGEPVHPDIVGFEREDRRMAGTMEVALRWCHARDARVRSFANSRPTPEGGTHAEGLRDGVAAAVNAYARKRRPLTGTGTGTGTDTDLGADRIGEGLTAIVSVKLDHPEFLGSTRGLLGSTAVRACVAEAVREHLETWLEEHPEQAAAIVGRMPWGI
ncbi:DNA gyrase subunit B [Streptomyces sp. NPDC014894]|uniref:DNA gyrase subunit B n=1 Tax=Streptomyces sp. NPDC014894 TaxID=3364931 RepID=UPI003700492B